MFNCVEECYTAKKSTKKEGHKTVAINIPCEKITADQCPMYDPEIKWKDGRVCNFPNAALQIKEQAKPNYRKHRNR